LGFCGYARQALVRQDQQSLRQRVIIISGIDACVADIGPPITWRVVSGNKPFLRESRRDNLNGDFLSLVFKL
jgi:hypothetical protein